MESLHRTVEINVTQCINYPRILRKLTSLKIKNEKYKQTKPMVSRSKKILKIRTDVSATGTVKTKAKTKQKTMEH